MKIRTQHISKAHRHENNRAASFPYSFVQKVEATYIRGIRYKFPKEDVFVAVQGVDDDVHQS